MINIIEKFRQWHAQNVAVSALNRMDERMLNDIGIHRADIPRYVRGLK